MAICEAYRIPHSHFLGGPLVWTQQDRDKAIWERLHRNERSAESCPNCGIHPDSVHEYEWAPVHCPSCAQRERVLEEIEGGGRTMPRGTAPRRQRRQLEVVIDGDYRA